MCRLERGNKMGKGSWRGIWEMFAALVFYDLVTTMVMIMLKDGKVLTVQCVSALVAGAAFMLLYIRKKKIEHRGVSLEKEVWKNRRSCFQILYLILFGIALSLSINGLIDRSNLKSIFPGYCQTAQAIAAPPLWLQILAAGVVIPWTEELIFRGFGFSQLRQFHSFWTAAGISTLAFGVYHGNVVQGLYAAVIGLFLSWVMEKKGCFIAPWLVHVSANLTSVLGGNVVKLKEWTVGVSIMFLAILVWIIEKSSRLTDTHH